MAGDAGRFFGCEEQCAVSDMLRHRIAQPVSIAFAARPGGGGQPLPINAADITNIARFLRGLNAIFNIQMASNRILGARNLGTVIGDVARVAWESVPVPGINADTVLAGKPQTDHEDQTDAERVIRNLARAGFNAIFTTSFGYMDPTATVAEEFPDTYFVHVSGYKKNETNFANLFGGMESMKYLVGMIAGARAAAP